MTIIYDFSGGMESAAMVYICRDEIRSTGAVVRWANTGKQFVRAWAEEMNTRPTISG